MNRNVLSTASTTRRIGMPCGALISSDFDTHQTPPSATCTFMQLPEMVAVKTDLKEGSFEDESQSASPARPARP
jgi:hypothetical protein